MADAKPRVTHPADPEASTWLGVIAAVLLERLGGDVTFTREEFERVRATRPDGLRMLGTGDGSMHLWFEGITDEQKAQIVAQAAVESMADRLAAQAAIVEAIAPSDGAGDPNSERCIAIGQAVSDAGAQMTAGGVAVCRRHPGGPVECYGSLIVASLATAGYTVSLNPPVARMVVATLQAKHAPADKVAQA